MSLDTVVRDKVWKSLKSIDSIFAEEVRRCINKIEKRQFDVGLRVKKLKGVSRIVWEARINQDSRLVQRTLRKPPERHVVPPAG